MKSTVPHNTTKRLRIIARGVIQGVGFRPFVCNAARRRGLAGFVRNTADSVQIEVEGPPTEVEGFVESLRSECPRQAVIDQLEVKQLPSGTSHRPDGSPTGHVGEFEIRPSDATAPPQPTIPADLATCPECLEEIGKPSQRRYGYPFTNCTNCGPRWSIIEGLPYDRPLTTMCGFAMCDACRAEYEAPTDRRFHAQPIACPQCGPRLQLLRPSDWSGTEAGSCDSATNGISASDSEAGRQPDSTATTPPSPFPLAEESRGTTSAGAILQLAADAVAVGQILAIKGLGGFQLIVDAMNEAAVVRLRARKRRPDKPLAVMLRDVDEARRYCEVSPEEAGALTSPQAPILLLRRKVASDTATPFPARAVKDETAAANAGYASIAEAVAPHNPYLGVMLPYTPLHHLLMERLARPIVCTSGNLSEEPMATTTSEAVERLGTIADLILTHNRPIARPVDDSVARRTPAGLQILRRARGYAPQPIALGRCLPTILAVGGHLKNVVGLSLGSRAVLSAHVGDLDTVASVDAFGRAVDDLLAFFDVRPETIACDLHPDYASTRRAEQLSAHFEVPLVRVQHHHAHVAAIAAEHQLRGPVLGFSWDGTGYGPDGSVWGGEVLLCEKDTARRVAHLRTFPLPGGDRASREPRRSALGLIWEMWGSQAADADTLPAPLRPLIDGWFTPTERAALWQMLARGVGSPRTSSMGRLFDAVAALLGMPPVISFEGEAAMQLEFAADVEHHRAYPVRLGGGSPIVIHWEPALAALIEDLAAGVPRTTISARFHNMLAEAAVRVARRVRCDQVALTGGCFQNALLEDRVRRRLEAEGTRTYTAQKVPPGDGGIALGQLLVAADKLETNNT